MTVFEDIYHAPFSISELTHWLHIAELRWPGAELRRSREGTGNIVIYQDGEYRAVLQLGERPFLTDFDEPDD